MHTFTRHSARCGRLWILAIAVILLIAVHGSILYYASSHVVLSAGVIAGVVALIVIKHLGLLGPVFAVLRRHRSKRGQPDEG